MDAGKSFATVEDLLEQSRWVSALAKRLVKAGAPFDAADVEQETWVAALEHRPKDGRPLREWLGAVLRNVVRQGRRGESRRGDRERRAARREALPSTADLVVRASAQRRVVEAVVALPEPYRTTILLRFFEGLPPRRIAKELGVPVETVQTRLRRGIARLREALDEAHGGDRGAWMLALLPLARRPPGLLPLALETSIVTVKTKAWIAALAALAAIAVWWAIPRPESKAASPATAERPAAPARASAEAMAAVPPSPRERAAESTAESAPAPRTAPPAPDEAVVRGRVLDAVGRPAAAVAVTLEPSNPLARGGERARVLSLADGTFTMPHSGEPGRLVAADETLVTVLAGLVGDRAPAGEIVVVVAPRLEISGSVVDEARVPVAGARVEVQLPEAFRARFDAILDRSLNVEPATQSDGDGAFALAAAPAIDGAVLRASLDGFEPHAEPLPAASTSGQVVVLTRPSSADGLVRGRVIDRSGGPVAGARVAFGLDTTLTSDDGGFAFRIDDPKSIGAQLHKRPRSLVAVKRGHLPGRFDPPMRGDEPAWPAWVTLRLGDEPLSISGRVVDAKDQPCPKAWVWLSDATPLGVQGDRLTQVENVLAGAEGESFHRVEADGEGRFVLDGLLHRAYRIEAMLASNLIRVESEPIDAGTTGVVLRIPTDDVHARVSGRVVSHRGRPVAGASVFPMSDVFRAKLDGEVVSTNHQNVSGTTTDAEGRFELRNVPKNLVYLRIEGPTLLPLEYGRYWDDDPRFADAIAKGLPKEGIDALEIVVDQRCHFQVELADPSAGDAVAVLDRDGRELIISVFHGNGREERPHVAVVDGRTPAMAVSDAGCTLVLLEDGAEVARQPLDLEPGALRHLRF
jgi:RNA polymerase sigma factor (sigma-70 family)